MKKKYNNLKDVRNAIDKLDDKILPLMIKRSQLVENALELKKLKSQIRDPKRIKIILDKIEKNSENSEVDKKLLRNIWSNLTGIFKENPYDYMDASGPGSFDFWCYLLLRIVAIFIIPVWLILGLATAGWLWPPQVRERLLCQTKVRRSRADIAIKAKKEVSKLRHELRNLKREVLYEKKVRHSRCAMMSWNVCSSSSCFS